jgi:hypothetical protein
MSATALARGRILEPLERVIESLEILHRDLAPFIAIDRIGQFDDDVSCFIIAAKNALSQRKKH